MNIREKLERICCNNIAACTDRQLYEGLLRIVKETAAEREDRACGQDLGVGPEGQAGGKGTAAGKTEGRVPDMEAEAGEAGKCQDKSGKKKVYYISAEFLIGKLLANNLINLGIYDKVDSILKAHGRDMARIEDAEPEPSLGNGGLGRLAACFMDSIATLGLPGEGIGLNYHFGLFRQKFKDGLQAAEKDAWIEPESWLTKTNISFDVFFGDHKVTSRLYDIDVIGYDSGVNKLRLFDLESVDESLVKEGITFDKTAVDKNLTLFLYPDDSDEEARSSS